MPCPPVGTSCKSSPEHSYCTSIEYDISSGCAASQLAAKPLAQSKLLHPARCAPPATFCCLLHLLSLKSGACPGLLCIMSTAATKTALGPCSAHFRISTVKYSHSSVHVPDPTCTARRAAGPGPHSMSLSTFDGEGGFWSTRQQEYHDNRLCVLKHPTSSWVVARLVHARTSRQHCHEGTNTLLACANIGMKATRKELGQLAREACSHLSCLFARKSRMRHCHSINDPGFGHVLPEQAGWSGRPQSGSASLHCRRSRCGIQTRVVCS